MQFIYYPTYARLDGLLAGIVLAMLSVYRHAFWTRLQVHTHALSAAGLILLGLSAWIFDDTMTYHASVFGYPLLAASLAMIVAAAAAPGSVWARLTLPGVRWLAAASYSLYLVHKAIFKLVYTHLPDAMAHEGTLTFLICAACAIGVAAMLHHGVERPFLRLRDRRRPASTTSEEAAIA